MATYPTFGVRVWAARLGFGLPLDERPIGAAGALGSAGPPELCEDKLPLIPLPGVSGLLPEKTGEQNEITVVFTAAN